MTTALAPVEKTRVLRTRRGTETWGAKTPDGTWGMDRLEDAGTSWEVTHLPSKTVVCDYLGSLRQCRAYVASGEAKEDLERLQAEERGGSMSNPDQMALIDRAEDLDGARIEVHRDYGDAIVFGHRLDAERVGWLRRKLDEWEAQRAAFIAGLDEDDRACWEPVKTCRYDVLPDLALLFAAVLRNGRAGAVHADRIAERLGLGEDDSAETVTAELRKALGLEVHGGDS